MTNRSLMFRPAGAARACRACLHSRRAAAVLVVAAMAALSCGAVFLPGCSADPVARAGGSRVTAYPSPAFPQKDSEGFYQVDDPIYVGPDDEVVVAANAFAAATSGAVLGSAEGPNAAYSPLSLYYALSMAAQGARGQTRDQLMAFLQTADTPQAPAQCNALFLSMYANPSCEMKLANSVWLSATDGPFEQGFVDCMTQDFMARIFEAEFGTEEAHAAMAAWVAENTGGGIEPTFRSRPDTLLMLLNTVNFRAAWVSPFNPGSTREGSFMVSPPAAGPAPASAPASSSAPAPAAPAPAAPAPAAPASAVTVDFMHLDKSDQGHGVLVEDEFMRAGLYFEGGASMDFILPAPGVSVHDILADPELFAHAVAGDTNMDVGIRFAIPKFAFETSFEMTDLLQDMGLDLPFSANADFSGISGTASRISAVKQDTRISIDEEGAEASACTVVGMEKLAAPLPPDSAIDFVCDRPFIYTIASPEGALLFVGVVGDPSR